MIWAETADNPLGAKNGCIRLIAVGPGDDHYGDRSFGLTIRDPFSTSDQIGAIPIAPPSRRRPMTLERRALGLLKAGSYRNRRLARDS